MAVIKGGRAFPYWPRLILRLIAATHTLPPLSSSCALVIVQETRLPAIQEALVSLLRIIVVVVVVLPSRMKRLNFHPDRRERNLHERVTLSPPPLNCVVIVHFRCTFYYRIRKRYSVLESCFNRVFLGYQI